MNRKASQPVISGLIALFTAFCFLLLCSKNSPLYPMNDWVDVNCFMTVARSMLNGKVLYVGIYEQKGPILYFVYLIAALIRSDSFIGVFLIEWACFSAFLYYAAKLFRLFRTQGSAWQDFAVMTVAAFIAVNVRSFAHGGSVEEMNLFMMTASLYFVQRAIESRSSVGRLPAFAIGCFAAVALWTKFTLCGFYLGLCVYIFIAYCIDRELRKKLVPEMLLFAVGAALVSVPVFLYFDLHNAVGELLTVYFRNNIVVYAAKEGTIGTTLLSTPLNLLCGGKELFEYNWIAVPFLLFIAVYYLFLRRDRKRLLLPILSCAAFLFLTTFFSETRYMYYSYGFIAFLPSGLSCAADAAEGLLKKRIKAKPLLLRTGAALLLPALLAVSFFINGNTYLLKYTRESMPQYRFAEKMKEHPDSTLLNYNFLDGGFYFASGKLPVTKFFCRLNVMLYEMNHELYITVKDKKVDYLVTRDLVLEEKFPKGLGYHLVDTVTMVFEDVDRTYRLYERDGL